MNAEIVADLRSKITWRDERIAEYLAEIARCHAAFDAMRESRGSESAFDLAHADSMLGEIRDTLEELSAPAIPESRPSFDGPIVGVRELAVAS